MIPTEYGIQELQVEGRMTDSMQIISGVTSAALFLATFLALWISGRIILRNYDGNNRVLHFILWLALAGLILTPLLDFILYLGSILNLIIPSSDQSGTISVFLGMAPFMYFLTIRLILGIAVYGLTLYYIRRLEVPDRLPNIQGLKLRNWEFGFILLGIAGLVNNIVRGIVFNFVSINFPSLITSFDQSQLFIGFWITWLIAFIILIGAMFCMNELLYRREDKLSS
jgi:hypothetical protein